MAETTIFGDLIVRLSDFGFLDFFLPFVFTAAITFAFLRKSKVVSESPFMNGIIAFVVGMLVMALPVLANVSFTEQFSTFFVQVTFLIVGLIVAAVIMSMFFPSMGAILGNWAKNPVILLGFFIVGVVIFLSSGLVGVFIEPTDPEVTGIEPDTPGPDRDIVILVAIAIIIMVIIIIFAVANAIVAPNK